MKIKLSKTRYRGSLTSAFHPSHHKEMQMEPTSAEEVVETEPVEVEAVDEQELAELALMVDLPD